MAESGQPPLPAPAWQAITTTTQPEDSQWQVSNRRYLSESSLALLLTDHHDPAAIPDHQEVPQLTAP
jgi:hypothetical protein